MIKEIWDKIRLYCKKKIRKLLGYHYVIEGKCKKCGYCCRHFCIVLEGGKILSTEEELNKILKGTDYKKFKIYKDENGRFTFCCTKLTEDNRCSDYKNRLPICRQYPQEEIIIQGGYLPKSCGYRLIPITPFKDVLQEIDKARAGENNN